MQTDTQHYLDAIQRYAADLVAIRRDIHHHPELGFAEDRTSDLVAERLEAWGFQVERGIGKTGLVGRLRCGDGPKRLGLRADMDALPIEERTSVPHSSCHPGVMHACGHDGHTAMLLGAARYLAQTRRFNGTLNLIFQPAEENFGGARRMLDEGLFERYPCDSVFAMHNMPGYPTGKLVFRDGAMMASSDYVTVTVTGVGGHGSSPHHGRDPVVAAASIVMALQTLVSRNVNPFDLGVVTVGAIHGGAASNVIPEKVTLEISVRAMSAEVRALLEQRIKELIDGQSRSFGVQAEVEYRRGYPVLVNTPRETQFARETALALLGPDEVIEQGAGRSGSEDFAYMLEECPGCYLFIGNGTGKSTPMLHNPRYDFNDEVLVRGAAYWACLTERFLA
ncbi:M20 aminoacylase family protein [Alicycliphilus sp. T452]|jgi:hippurate hydrolase